ncbi:MAG TPA: sugar phosphate isomerase/epimerase [Clostridia bacterium]|nr:sugar phosphate isomerase/epimerase [Clostridia bacterium]
MSFKIGVITDSFRCPLENAIEKAAFLGADGVQIYATGRELSHDTSDDVVKKIMRHLSDAHLELSALCGDIGAFDDPNINIERVKRSKKIVDLAVKMGTIVVTTHIGTVPEDKSHEKYKIIHGACLELGRYADSQGVKFAIETGPEKAHILRMLLDDLDCTGIAVNFDPANLPMCVDDDARAAVALLAPFIVHTHAKDGIMLSKYTADPRYSELAKQRKWLELPLGEGDVGFPTYLEALRKTGYKGFLTIEREVGDEPAKDIANAVSFLRKLI